MIKKILNKLSTVNTAPAQPPAHKNAIDLLLSHPGAFQMTEEERAKMTVSCRDTDYIPKVAKAGECFEQNGEKLQLMHNGLTVVQGGYFGDWMAQIITALRGHHEPQEEKVFYEVLKRVKPNATMMELGSFWAYYSLWFNKAVKGAQNICCEPDPNNMKIGKRNAKINGAKNITFVAAAAGADDGKQISFQLESDREQNINVPIRTVDSLLAEHKIKKLDILHFDVQGVELDTLRGAQESIKAGKIRFIIVSTHHYMFSRDPATHLKCVEFIKQNGGHIITSHTIPESFSGDGLIAASFDPADADFTVDTSLNHTDHSLFRPYEKDLEILAQAYEA